MTGIELQRRAEEAMKRKWGEVWGIDLEHDISSNTMPISVGCLIENVVADCQMIFAGLIDVEDYFEEA